MTREEKLSSPSVFVRFESQTISAEGSGGKEACRTQLEENRVDVMARFGIAQPEEGVIVVRLGDKSPFSFIRAVFNLATAFGERPAVNQKTLADWATDPRFIERGPKELVISVEGCVPQTGGMTRDAALKAGLLDVSSAHLAVAHVASQISSRGQDLFRGYHVMTGDQNTTLHYSPFGLFENSGIHSQGGNSGVAACRQWKS